MSPERQMSLIKIIKNIRLLGLTFFLFTFSIILPTDSPNFKIGSYYLDKSLLNSGDIIFRRGTSFVSMLVLNLDKRSPYSHTGIIKLVGDEIFVVHAVPSEEAGEKDLTKIDPLNKFLRKDRATAIAVYRFIEDAITPDEASAFAYRHGLLGTEFDGSFDLSDDSKLYCTELIWKAYLDSGIDLIEGQFDQLEIPFSKGHYILPGTLLESKKLKQIFSINFL